MKRKAGGRSLPSPADRWVLAGAALIWVGAAVGRVAGWKWAAVCAVSGLVAAAIRRRGWVIVLAACLLGGALSGAGSASRDRRVLEGPALTGPVRVAGWALDDLRPGARGNWLLFQPTHLRRGEVWVDWEGPPLLVDVDDPAEVDAHDRVRVDGTARPLSGLARGDPYAGRITARRLQVLAPAADPLFRVGNAVRHRIGVQLAERGWSASAALVSGFLIGDVRRLPPSAAEQLRRAGLSHFVAVSGSNVAVFLALWWVVAGPLALGPRRRALGGIAGLALFAVITRWEPSVLRAAAMAGLVLVARAAGIALRPWMALGAAVGGLLLVSGELTGDVGFQLSVAATAGVMAGAHLFEGLRFRRLAASLGATVGAQAAVAPLLLAHFGAVPLVSPLANLLAAPLVLASTIGSGLGLLTGIDPLIDFGLWVAGRVLDVARVASPWPQLGVGGVVAVGAMGAATRSVRLRPAVALASAAALAATIGWPVTPIARPCVVFLDTGQGDAVLLLGTGGETVLVDGGPEPVLLLRKLHGYGVKRIDLMVMSHPHADHVSGLVAAVDGLPVQRLWHPGYGEGEEDLLATAARRGVTVEVPQRGWRADIGSIHLEVLGPLRRYASPNDQSLVLLVSVEDRTVLLPGDIEAIAQRELGPLLADVMKVPHQGARTSDLVWLSASAGETAVISVGPNTFGHPDAEVIAALEEGGATVLRTDEDGDIVLPLSRWRAAEPDSCQ